jgi:four helix bundle protein
MAIARTFRDLNVYREAQEAVKKIFELSRQFPAEERYSLTDQIRRSSRAVKAMIAEARGRRRYKAVFVNKLDEALGEATETQSWLDDAKNSSYLSIEQFEALDSKYTSIGPTTFVSTLLPRITEFFRRESAKANPLQLRCR